MCSRLGRRSSLAAGLPVRRLARPGAPTAEPWRAKAKFDLVAAAYAARSAHLLATAAHVVGEEGVAGRADGRPRLRRRLASAFRGDAAPTTQTGCRARHRVPRLALRRRSDVSSATRLVERGSARRTTTWPRVSRHPAAATRARTDRAPGRRLRRADPADVSVVAVPGARRRDDDLGTVGRATPRRFGAVESLGGTGSSMVSFNHYAYERSPTGFTAPLRAWPRSGRTRLPARGRGAATRRTPQPRAARRCGRATETRPSRGASRSRACASTSRSRRMRRRP